VLPFYANLKTNYDYADNNSNPAGRLDRVAALCFLNSASKSKFPSIFLSPWPSPI
jgi:hypothetical protein